MSQVACDHLCSELTSPRSQRDKNYLDALFKGHPRTLADVRDRIIAGDLKSAVKRLRTPPTPYLSCDPPARGTPSLKPYVVRGGRVLSATVPDALYLGHPMPPFDRVYGMQTVTDGPPYFVCAGVQNVHEPDYPPRNFGVQSGAPVLGFAISIHFSIDAFAAGLPLTVYMLSDWEQGQPVTLNNSQTIYSVVIEPTAMQFRAAFLHAATFSGRYIYNPFIVNMIEDEINHNIGLYVDYPVGVQPPSINFALINDPVAAWALALASCDPLLAAVQSTSTSEGFDPPPPPLPPP